MATYTISGNTYTHKDTLRTEGAKWNSDRKVWTIEIRERGMKRNDGILVKLRRLGGLTLTREGAEETPPSPPARAPRAKRTTPTVPPVGPQLRNDRSPYADAAFLVAILEESDIAECEGRQGLTATEVPATTDKAELVPAGRRRVGCVVIHTDRISQSAADDNGYCGRYGAIVRLATVEECAPAIERSRRSASLAACATWLEAQIAYGAPNVIRVSDSGELPPIEEREELRPIAPGPERQALETSRTLVIGRKTGYSGAVTDGGTHFVITATSVVSYHGGYYDAYRSMTCTLARTELLVAVIRALATESSDDLLVCADRIRSV